VLIGRLFGSKLRAKILGWFFTHVDERFFIRQLKSLLDEDPTNLSRELSRLESMKILISETEGRQKYFCVNKTSPFYEEMKGLILKTTGVAGTIKYALRKVEGIKYAFVYGSFAKNQENPESDVDLMVIGKANLDEIEDAIAETEERLKRTINITFFTLREFRGKVKSKDSFIKTVLNNPILMLIGDENEIRRP
jgi:predicted nucleotidyltransferase